MTTEAVTIEVSPETARVYQNAPLERRQAVSQLLEVWLQDEAEPQLTRRQATETIRSIQAGSVRKGTDRITPEEIEAEIQAVRRERRS